MIVGSDYYTGTCKNCGEDCDSEFCSWACEEEWTDGYGDYLYEIQRDKDLEDTL